MVDSHRTSAGTGSSKQNRERSGRLSMNAATLAKTPVSRAPDMPRTNVGSRRRCARSGRMPWLTASSATRSVARSSQQAARVTGGRRRRTGARLAASASIRSGVVITDARSDGRASSGGSSAPGALLPSGPRPTGRLLLRHPSVTSLSASLAGSLVVAPEARCREPPSARADRIPLRLGSLDGPGRFHGLSSERFPVISAAPGGEADRQGGDWRSSPAMDGRAGPDRKSAGRREWSAECPAPRPRRRSGHDVAMWRAHADRALPPVQRLHRRASFRCGTWAPHRELRMRTSLPVNYQLKGLFVLVSAHDDVFDGCAEDHLLECRRTVVTLPDSGKVIAHRTYSDFLFRR